MRVQAIRSLELTGPCMASGVSWIGDIVPKESEGEVEVEIEVKVEVQVIKQNGPKREYHPPANCLPLFIGPVATSGSRLDTQR